MLNRFDLVHFMASTDDLATNTAFAKANSAEFPVLNDPERVAAAAYGVLAENGYARRWTFYIDPEGRVLEVDRKVRAFSAGPDIVERLKALGVAPRQPDVSD